MPERLSCFIIMPYSQVSDEVYSQAILPALRSVPGADVLALRADELGPELTLRARVEGTIQSASFCIVDITAGNPNVMYELGYAIANAKPTVLIQQSGSGSPPANLSSRIVLRYTQEALSSLSVELGCAIRELLKSRSQGAVRQRSGGFSSALISDTSAYDRLAGSARYTLSALVSSPRLLLHDVLPRIDVASKPELRIRVVCANPESGFSRLRSEDSGIRVSTYRAEMWSQLKEMITAHKRAELRLTDGIVATSLYVSDDIVLAFPYLAAGRSRESAGIEISQASDSRGFAVFRQQFGQAWSRAIQAELPERWRTRQWEGSEPDDL